ncbi:MAG: hypothetical protein MJK04_06675, partial [Psychrosphaera sp.]|nr:hypothetical protein [Psychrosphaera sp.]
MSYVSKLRCSACNKEYPNNQLMNLCPVDNRPLEMIIDVARVKAELPDFKWYRPDLKSMWRFGALMALDINNPADAANIMSFGEG